MLFNFPSRYLFAIGLATVFSRRWSLPPTSGCIPKQPDSEKTRSDRGERPCGPDTRYGTRPRSEGHRRPPTTAQRLPYVTVRRAPKARGFDAGQIPIHSPLLKESRLVSFPPLNNMLKFSGCSRLNSGRTKKGSTARARSAEARRRPPPRALPLVGSRDDERARSDALDGGQPSPPRFALDLGGATHPAGGRADASRRSASQEADRRARWEATLRQTCSRDGPESAIRVQKVDVQCVLQFALTIASCCVLHRLASRVIHR